MLRLSAGDDGFERRFITRFDPDFWTVNFPRPMMAAVTTPGGEALDVTLVFYRQSDLAGLIWESEDRFDHPLLAYETRRDYRGVVFSFRWQSSGILPLDAINGPTLTIEGRDAAGSPRSWFVRLWNYAEGAPEDAVVTLDFDDLDGGFLLPQEADPVYPGDIDRLFISMVPPAFDSASDAPLVGGAAEAQVSLRDIRVTGGQAELALQDDYIRPHATRVANGYDDVFNVTPARVLRNVLQLGYRDWLTHYVGMSHYYALAWDAAESRFIIDPGLPALNAATAAWHADYFARLARFGSKLVLSLSYELFYENAPVDWAQRAHDGAPALTGWEPPSTLVSPTNDAALGYLESVYAAFGDLMQAAGLPAVFQIGEPWWWTTFRPAGAAPNDMTNARVPHFYDDATLALYPVETGLPVPARHMTTDEIPTPEQVIFLDWLGEKLGASTLRLRDFLKNRYAGAEVTLLFFTPQVLDPLEPMLQRANYPMQQWAYPAFDFFQVEDYDHVIGGLWAAHARDIDRVMADLGYPASNVHFFAGFVLLAEDSAIWRNIARALDDGARRDFAELFVWAYPQIQRDGVVLTDRLESSDMAGFHEVRLPDRISFGSSDGPVYSTEVVVTASGYEQRNRNWRDARADYDIATGIQTAEDLKALTAFFRARAGRAYGFRFKDWADYSSAGHGQDPSPFDQPLGTGDGVTTAFQLVKQYGDDESPAARDIVKPVDGTVRVAVNGVETVEGWSCNPASGIVTFDAPPAPGSALTAGFEFDVPVRFDMDRLSVSLEAFEAGEANSIRLVEIRIGEMDLA